MNTADLKVLSTAQLLTEFSNAFSYTAEGLRRMAFIWQELKERGALGDLSEEFKRNEMFAFLPDIADGTLTAEAVLKFGGDSHLLRAVKKLVPEAQKGLVETNLVKVVRPSSAGGTETKACRPLDLKVREIQQVFSPEGYIRSPHQQRHMVKPVTTSSLKKCDFDLWNALTEPQRFKLSVAAGELGMTPAELAVQTLVEARLVPSAKTARKPAKNPTTKPIRYVA